MEAEEFLLHRGAVSHRSVGVQYYPRTAKYVEDAELTPISPWPVLTCSFVQTLLFLDFWSALYSSMYVVISYALNEIYMMHSPGTFLRYPASRPFLLISKMLTK